MYCAIYATKTGDRILFYHQGGVDVGDVDQKASFINVEIDRVTKCSSMRVVVCINICDIYPRSSSPLVGDGVSVHPQLMSAKSPVVTISNNQTKTIMAIVAILSSVWH